MPVCSGHSSGRSSSPDEEPEADHGKDCPCAQPLRALPPDIVYAFVPCSKNGFVATAPIYDCDCPCRKTYAIDWRIPPLFSRGAQIFQLVDIRELHLDVMAENRVLKRERYGLMDQTLRLQRKLGAVETILHAWSSNKEEGKDKDELVKAFEELKQGAVEEGDLYDDDRLPPYASDGPEDTDIRPSTSGVTFQKKNKRRKKKNKGKK